MTARLTSGTASKSGDDAPPQAGGAVRENKDGRVISVAPPTARELGDGKMTGREVFLTPRVIDQQAFDELAGGLRSLVEEAKRSSEALAQQVEEAGRCEEKSTRASVHLQERLRLGARMLKAFQAQISRVESAVAEVESRRHDVEEVQRRVQEQLGRVDARMAERTGEFEARLEEVDAAINTRIESEIEQMLARFDREHLAPRREELGRLERSIEEAARRAEALLSQVEGAEKNISVLLGRHGSVAVELEAKAQQARQVIALCEEGRQELNKTLWETAERVDAADTQSRQIEETVAESHRRAEAMQEEFARRLEDVAGLMETLDRAAAVRDELAALHERLAPWEGMLLAEERMEDGTPRPVARTIEHLRTTLATDLGRLSASMRELAERVDRALPGSAVESPADERDTGSPPGADAEEREKGSSALEIKMPDGPASAALRAEAAVAERGVGQR